MKQEEGNKLAQAKELIHKELLECEVIHGCVNCAHCDVDKNLCNLYNLQPPIRVVTFGCPNWVSIIPF